MYICASSAQWLEMTFLLFCVWDGVQEWESRKACKPWTDTCCRTTCFLSVFRSDCKKIRLNQVAWWNIWPERLLYIGKLVRLNACLIKNFDSILDWENAHGNYNKRQNSTTRRTVTFTTSMRLLNWTHISIFKYVKYGNYWVTFRKNEENTRAHTNVYMS